MAQALDEHARPLGALAGGLDDDIDARPRIAKAIERILSGGHCLIIGHVPNSEHNAIGGGIGVICLQIDQAGERSTGKPGIRRDGILEVPKQKRKIGAIGNTDIRNGLQRFGLIALRVCLHAISFPARFRLGYTVWWRPAALS